MGYARAARNEARRCPVRDLTHCSEVAQLITDRLPPDGTLESEMILVSLMRGDVAKGIRQCIPFDEWLATHLGDLCNKAQLIDENETEGDNRLCDAVLFAWADTLLNEERLWRMAISYLAVVHTPAARSKMRGVLFSVPLMNESDADEQFKQVEEVLSACIEYGMDDEVRIICKVCRFTHTASGSRVDGAQKVRFGGCLQCSCTRRTSGAPDRRPHAARLRRAGPRAIYSQRGHHPAHAS